jgi:hypothetical protein
MKIMEYDGRIELIPDRDISELKCLIWTQDSDFENFPNVKFFPKIEAVKPTSA